MNPQDSVYEEKKKFSSRGGPKNSIFWKIDNFFSLFLPIFSLWPRFLNKFDIARDRAGYDLSDDR